MAENETYLNGLGESFGRRADHAKAVALYIGDRINHEMPNGLDEMPFRQLRRDLEEMTQLMLRMEAHYLDAAFAAPITAKGATIASALSTAAAPEGVTVGAITTANCREITIQGMPEDPATLAAAFRKVTAQELNRSRRHY